MENLFTQERIRSSGWQSVHIASPEGLTTKLVAIRKNTLAIITDFDRTMTTHLVNGEERPSLISTLRSQSILSEEYSTAAYALFDHFNPIEIDTSRSVEDRSREMDIWWHAHLDLLTGKMTYARLEQLTGKSLSHSGSDEDLIPVSLRVDHIDQTINSGIIELRPGMGEFLEGLDNESIPLVIFSASGLGGDSIRSYLEFHNQLKSNIHVVSNTFTWSEEGIANGRLEPVIHVFNKEISAIRSQPEIYSSISDKRDIILLGDSTGDAHMADGHDADTVLKIGFLTKNPEKNLAEYMQKFDIVLVGDGGMDIVMDMLSNFQR